MEIKFKDIINDEKILNKSEKINISLVDVAKTIKQQLKKEYPFCKFSIQTQYYSMGCALHINVMETNFKIIKPFEELSERVLFEYGKSQNRTNEELKNMQERGNYPINGIRQETVYNPDVWNNGAFLTEKGFNLIKRITELTNKFNYDESDSQTDYFNVNFYLHLNIGKWDKPLVEIENEN